MRVSSDFPELDGMLVTVNDQQTQGVITSTPQNVYMFQAGDLKWRNIVRVSADEWEFEDLVREEGTGAMSYVAGLMRVDTDGEGLSLSFPTTGGSQEWAIVP